MNHLAQPPPSSATLPKVVRVALHIHWTMHAPLDRALDDWMLCAPLECVPNAHMPHPSHTEAHLIPSAPSLAAQKGKRA